MFAVEALVAFKLCIDLAEMNISWVKVAHKALKYHDLNQNIINIENFHVRALNGRRPSLENWLKSDISVISWMSVISLKSGDFIILVHQTV